MAQTNAPWPSGNGEMAARIRAHDWAATSLGPVAVWSERLKVMVEQVLASPQVSSLVCGAQRILIYNDVAAGLYGHHHPAALGRPLPETFPKGWATVAPLYDRAFAGETVQVAAQPVDTRSEGAATDAFDALLTPVREGDGHVAYVHMTGHEVGERLRAEATLRESDARHRLLIDSWAQAMWETDASGVVVTDSPSWRAYTGQSLAEWLGYGWLDAIHPDDRSYAERQWREAMAVHGLVDAEFRLRTSDGGWRWTNVRAAPVLDGAGHIEKWVGINLDIDGRRRVEAALRASEERFRQFAASSSDALWIRDAATLEMEYTSPAIETIYGITPDGILGDMQRWVDLIVPEDRDTATAHIRQAQVGGAVTHEFRIRRPSDGEQRWIRNTDFPLRDQHGHVQRIGGIAEDVTGERELRERQGVLLAELQHRTRNLLGVVRSMADNTMRRSADLADFQARYGDRLTALARVQGLLSRLDDGERITFDELIHAEMAALDGHAGRFALTGPNGVALRSSTVQTFALALHELATNAVKYGAFAQPRGRLEIRWWLERAEQEGRPWLYVSWRERDVVMPAAGTPVQGGGSGRELIERALPYQLGARTTYVMEADGVHCIIALPVPEQPAEKDTADA